jgi:hypothetical protein
MNQEEWYKYIFIYCPHCRVVKKLQKRKTYCACKQSYGWLHKHYRGFAIYGGDAIQLTVPSSKLKYKIINEKKAPKIQCPVCKKMIYSLSRHDFQWCPCGKTALDGGFDYQRVIGKEIAERLTNGE